MIGSRGARRAGGGRPHDCPGPDTRSGAVPPGARLQHGGLTPGSDSESRGPGLPVAQCH